MSDSSLLLDMLNQTLNATERVQNALKPSGLPIISQAVMLEWKNLTRYVCC